MPIICRMFELPAESAKKLTGAANLPDAIKSAKNHFDVYRYWHAIEYLLAQHVPESPSARWLSLGDTVSSAAGAIPAARLIPSSEVAGLHQLLQSIEPEQLIPYYDAATLDGAAVYPGTWLEWEETFDPLGQVLEHYSFLREFVGKRASAADAFCFILYSLMTARSDNALQRTRAVGRGCNPRVRHHVGVAIKASRGRRR